MKKEISETKNAEKMFVELIRYKRIININMVRVFFVCLISVSLLGLMPFMHPTVSLTEKRELHKFPKFTFSALLSGDYFDNIGLWFSDTFPLRDSFVGINAKITGLFGINDVEIHGDVIPADAGPEKSDNEETVTNAGSEPPAPVLEIEKIGAMAIIGNTGYEYYNFNSETADMYAAAVSSAADALSGKCRVFNTVVPTSAAITLDDNIVSQMNMSDQKAAIDYIYSKISNNVVCVNPFGILKEHKDEYLYFRTDHHWTAHAAYYSYKELMKAAGKDAADLSVFKEFVFDGFLGTFYTNSNMSAKLGATPDTVYAYEPPGIEYIHTFEVGYEKDYHIVSDANKLTESEKYLTFICGDHPLGVITNEQITDNSACLIIKESYGNPLAAYFTQNYHTVYVADIRKIKSVYGGTLDSFVTDYGVNDVFIVNNISATRNKQITDCLTDFIGITRTP